MNQPTLTNDVVLQKYADRLLIVLLQKREKAEVKSGGIYFGKSKELGICASELEIIANAGNAFLEEI